jgi:hypothetical protein
MMIIKTGCRDEIIYALIEITAGTENTEKRNNFNHEAHEEERKNFFGFGLFKFIIHQVFQSIASCYSYLF